MLPIARVAMDVMVIKAGLCQGKYLCIGMEKGHRKIRSKCYILVFAHEVAHLYQGRAGNVEALADAWLHEKVVLNYLPVFHTQKYTVIIKYI